MLDFFKKTSLELKDKIKTVYEEKEEEKKCDIAVGYTATQVAGEMNARAEEKFAKPKSYVGNRTVYDSGTAKRDIKKRAFMDDKVVRDPYTGKKLVSTIHEAKETYGKEWADHLAESDHVKPLEKIYEETKNNVWNTTKDIKEAANSDENLKVISRKVNNAKRSKTNEEYINDEEYLKNKGINLTREGKERAIKDGEIAEKEINRKLQKKSLDNIVKTGYEAGKTGAKNAGITAVTMSGIMNLVSVIKGEKTGEEAISDTVRNGGKAAVTGYAMSSSMTIVSHSLSNVSSEFIQGLARSNVPSNVITAVLVTGDTLKKWGEGDITTQECFIELGDKGLTMATMGYSMAMGQALIPIPIIGGAIGALIGTSLTSTYYSALIKELQIKELEQQERIKIIEECRSAIELEKSYREELEKYLNSYLKDYKEYFDTALSSMKVSFAQGDAYGVIAGANEITKKLGGDVQYESVEEFEKLLESDVPFVL